MWHRQVSSQTIEACTFDGTDGLGGARRTCVLAWVQDDEFASYLHPQGGGGGLSHRQLLGKGLREVIEEIHFSGSNFIWHQPPLLPGEYHRRIWRNGIVDGWMPNKRKHIRCYAPDFPELRSRCIALHQIQKILAGVFEVVTPGPGHDEMSGGVLRQLLLLSAVEVEGLLKGVYRANQATPTGNANINTYARLVAPMRLNEWGASFSYFDESGVARPFDRWSVGQPPRWWTAYNALKHEPTHPVRYRDVLDACLAVRVLLEAQFGPFAETVLPEAGLAAIEIVASPTWETEEMYYPSIGRHADGGHRSKTLF